MDKQTLLIGIDGGATKVSAWEIKYDDQHKTFSLGNASATKSYREIDGYIPDFQPIDLKIQLGEKEAGNVQPSQEEKQQAAVYAEACAWAIHRLVEETGCLNILIGIGMPGLKTTDKRGIEVVANGPRMLHYSEQLEARLRSFDINLLAPVNHLGSDADYCGIGENYSEDGLFREAQNAYYLGGGTGVADAMKLDGKLLTFDNAKSWITKSWELKSEEGLPLERVTSVSGIQRTYAELANASVEELNQAGLYPLRIAELVKKGDKAAIQTFEIVNKNLSRLLYERIVTLFQGWSGLFEFVNPNRSALNVEHEHRGKLFDSIIIGQRLGELFDDTIGNEVVRQPVLEQLSDLINHSELLDEAAKLHYTNIDSIVKMSKLREAPALGAGIDAFLSK